MHYAAAERPYGAQTAQSGVGVVGGLGWKGCKGAQSRRTCSKTFPMACLDQPTPPANFSTR